MLGISVNYIVCLLFKIGRISNCHISEYLFRNVLFTLQFLHLPFISPALVSCSPRVGSGCRLQVLWVLPAPGSVISHCCQLPVSESICSRWLLGGRIHCFKCLVFHSGSAVCRGKAAVHGVKCSLYTQESTSGCQSLSPPTREGMNHLRSISDCSNF